MANALGAIAACRATGAEPVAACASLTAFQPPKRRLERINPSSSIALFDDFAHHPTAVRETLHSLRASDTHGSLIAILEPRSNTMKRGIHRAELAQALSIADAAIVYRRTDLDWDPAELTQFTDGAKITVCESIAEIVDTVCDLAKPGDRIVMMSNGSFDGLGGLLDVRLD
jgi:UDP-N-acetylmuramate: L-alanyl-gamma-D-glutamyl-meso-diaminopimelate ligase